MVMQSLYFGSKVQIHWARWIELMFHGILTIRVYFHIVYGNAIQISKSSTLSWLTSTKSTFLSISYFYNCFRESVRLIHGMSKRFMLSFSKDLGHINLINFEWLYDHDIDPLDPFKVCVFLCSDKIHLQNVAITSLHAPQTESHNIS